MYKILGGDGKEYGPVPVETLRQWVQEGRANGRTQVRSEDMPEWRALSSIPELESAFNAPPTLGAPPPAVESGPQAVHDGDYELDIGGCVGRAWATLTSNFWLMVGGCAIYLLIQIGFSAFAQIPFIGPLFSLVNFVLAGPLIGGVYFFLLRLLRGQKAEAGDVFAGFRDNIGQLILGNIIPALISLAVAIPGIIMMVVPIVIMAHNDSPNPLLIGVAVAGFLLMFLPLFYLSVCWTFTIPLIMDRKLDFWSAMKASRRQVRRHWWMVLGMVIVIGLINMAGVLACCIGVFVTMPLGIAALALAYETLFLPRTAQPGQGA